MPGSTTVDMFEVYSALHTPRLILRALVGHPDVAPLKLIIVGKQGTGKTSFAYYAIKVALGLRQCHSYKVLGDKAACLNFLQQKYGLCLGRDCPPDGLDEELRRGMYVTVEDLQKRFPDDVESGAIKERKILFFDDSVMPGTYWHLGKKWRVTHYAFREFERFFRDFAQVLVMTAPTLNHIDRVYKSNAVIIMADVMHRREDGKYYNVYAKTVFQRIMTPNGIRTIWRPEYIDMVLHTPAFGLPEWLEKELEERRFAIIRDAAAKLRRLRENADEEEEAGKRRRGRRKRKKKITAEADSGANSA